MSSYRIVWAIDIDADTPQEAVKMAWDFLSSEGTATVFDALNEETGEVTSVDLWDYLYGEDGSRNESKSISWKREAG